MKKNGINFNINAISITVLMHIIIGAIFFFKKIIIINSNSASNLNNYIILFCIAFLGVINCLIIYFITSKQNLLKIKNDVITNFIQDNYELVLFITPTLDVLFTYPETEYKLLELNNILDIYNIDINDFEKLKKFIKNEEANTLNFKSENDTYYLSLKKINYNNNLIILISLSKNLYMSAVHLLNEIQLPVVKFNKDKEITFTNKFCQDFSYFNSLNSEEIAENNKFKPLFSSSVEDINNYYVYKEQYNSEKLLHAIIENNKEAVCIIDINLNIILANSFFKQNITEKNDLTSLFSKEVKEKLSSLINSKINNIKNILITINSKNYNCFIVKPSVQEEIIRIENKEVFIVYLNKIENILVDQQTAHSQKLQAIGQLAGGVAHDFNNLLTAMIGFCDLLLLKHGPGDTSFPEIMQIRQNVNRAAGLVRQLLAFSRKQTLQTEIIDITEPLDEIASLINRLMSDNVKLEIYHGRNLWLTKVDVGQFEQVIINLAVNARDAMSKNGGTLLIKTENATLDKEHPIPDDFIPPSDDEIIENGDYVRIIIKDAGCGISKSKIQKIFEPFYSTKEVGSGTGLGLATVYGIIRQTNGYIYVKSEENIGTEFHIYLPRYIPEKGEQVLHLKEDEKLAPPDLTGTGQILIIEDEDAVRMFAAQALTSKGYEVLEAASGIEGREKLIELNGQIDLVITDVMMPGINGPSMIKEVTRQFPDIKVIFISGYGEDAFVETYGENNRNFHFLAKPFNLKQLAQKVKDVLESK
ncbi:MAG: response regulator [Sphingobacteriia bacterium]|nr:response regulator [Sphingobacteriia bacterium]